MPKRKGRAASFFYGSWLWAAASSPSTASSSSSSGPGGEPKTPRSCLEPALPGSPSCTPDPHTPFRRRISMRNTNERKMLWAIPPPKDRSLLKTHPKRLVCSQTDDDDVGSRYPASQLDHGLEPQEDPRGSTGQVPPWNPAPEPASMGPTGAVLVGSGYSTPQPDVDHEPQVNLPGKSAEGRSI
ncbi:uncharacterized protein [Anser cygnoides]|uniref:uncharacterized protein isoform X2 n=1 Tax=Anser cygnoides TaxID=8845 RepID=UPI0034D21B2B